MIRILIADDHPLVREGLKKILKEEADIQLMGEAKNSDEILDILGKNVVDVAVLDVSMPGKSGLEMLTVIKSRWPDVAVLILSMHQEERFAIRALKLGASGYITKDSAPYDLVKAIRKAVRGGKYITQAVAEQLANEIGQQKNIAPHKNLSDREHEIFCLIASGKTTKEIAEDLNLSAHTVYTHREHIFEKLNVKSAIELTQYALRNKLID